MKVKNRVFKYYINLLAIVVQMVAMTACDSEDAVEFNLQGTWKTSQNIDYGADTWGEGTIMIFNDKNQGTIESENGEGYLSFEWHWMDEGFNSMELTFADGSHAYIAKAMAGAFQFKGTWYNSYEDFNLKREGQSFSFDKQR